MTFSDHGARTERPFRALGQGEIFSMNTDVWRTCAAPDGLRNGDATTSSLAAKGFRSVRPNLQDKRSPTPPLGAPGPALSLRSPPARKETEHGRDTGRSRPPPARAHVSPPLARGARRAWSRPTPLRARPHARSPPVPPSPDPRLLAGGEAGEELSRCSSRTQSDGSTALLEELRNCGLDATESSETPSPTLSQMSAATDEATLTSATTANTATATAATVANRRQPPQPPAEALLPSGVPPPPPALSPSMALLQQGRSAEPSDYSDVLSPGHTHIQSSATPTSRSPDEKKASAIKTPLYTGSSPVDESGVPNAVRTTVDRPKDWYKTMFKQIHVVHKPDDQHADAYNATYSVVNTDSYSPSNPVQAHPPPRTHTYRPICKSTSDNSNLAFRESPLLHPTPPLVHPSPSPVHPAPSPRTVPPQTQPRPRDTDRATPEMNEWGPPDRKVDTRKYRAEPRSIFEYEPGKSSVLEQDRPINDLSPDEIDLENEPWYKFFSELEFGRPPPKKILDYNPDSSSRGFTEMSLYPSPVDRIPGRGECANSDGTVFLLTAAPHAVLSRCLLIASFSRSVPSSASDYRKRRKSEPVVAQPQRPQSSQNVIQSPSPRRADPTGPAATPKTSHQLLTPIPFQRAFQRASSCWNGGFPMSTLAVTIPHAGTFGEK
ncbi:hypothetical protein ANANG_G00134150 [Anguilla anguilla]|uniref:SoHo domain-containing protein n=1 Tax=Anguilla anguilla TaxID=7936 RepID=A0A9D3MBJ6_ANGAN|nr:hypothetical protein ANANG_G00134150 [Anguilla anguilla]